jgi:hypothetical protein
MLAVGTSPRNALKRIEIMIYVRYWTHIGGKTIRSEWFTNDLYWRDYCEQKALNANIKHGAGSGGVDYSNTKT